MGEKTSSGRDKVPKSSGGGSAVPPSSFTSTISSVSVVNNQIVLNGQKLSLVNSVQITGPSGFNETLNIESQSSSTLVANGLRNISFVMNGVFDLIISNAQGAATFQVTFTISDGSITGSMLSSMGASVGQVLTFDGTDWVPNDLTGLTYAGNWNGNLNIPDLSGGGSAGEYYIVSNGGSYDLSGGTGTDSWTGGDWVVWNSTLNQWEKIDNASGVVTFNGRNGTVVPLANDYTWAQIDKTTSSITDIADVDTTGAVSGKILKFDGTTWVLADDDSGGAALPQADGSTDGYITSTDWNTFNNKASITTGTSSQYLKGDLSLGDFETEIRGTDLSGFSSTTGAINATDTILSAINKLDGNTNAKEDAFTAGTAAQYFRGDKTWQPLSTDSLSIGTNKFYTATQARTDLIESASLTNGQTTTAPSSDVVFDQLALKQDLITTTDALDVNSITTNSQAGVSMTPYGIAAGNTSEFRFYELTGNGSHYAGFKAPDSLGASIIWTLPANDGTVGQILSTNGSGVLSWVTDTGGGGASASTFDVTPIGTGAGQTGEMRYQELAANGTNYVTFKAPDNLAADLAFILPATDGTGGNVLTTDGSGTLSWSAPAGGSALPPANAGQNGYITSGDWSTFNNKQDSLTTGSTAQYLKGDLSLGTLNDEVLSSLITGFTSSSGVLSATDTLISAINKLDGNISNKEASLTAGTSAQYYRGDKTWQTLNTDSVAEGSNLYFTNARARSAVIETSSLTNGQTTTAPSSDVVFDRLALKQDSLDASTDISINSLTTDSQAALSLLSFGSSAGQTGEFRFYDLNDSNYVAFKSPDTVASNIIWTLPPSDGSSGQILSTNGSGVLSWVTDSGGGGSSASTFDVTPIGTGAGQTGEMRYQELAANGSNFVTFKAPDSLAADLSFVLPATDGTSGNVLTTNGSGTLSWSAPAGGSALPPANAGQNGYLTSGDWTIFNNKQSTITDTTDLSTNSVSSDSQFGFSLDPYGSTTGQTGSIRFKELAANGTNFAAFKASDSMGANVTWALPDSDGSTGQVLSTDGSGQLSWVAAGSSMSQANGSTDGFLSMGDWTTFNNKESAITAGTTAQYFRGDKTWQALTTDSLTIGTNQFYTAAAARSDLIETASLTNGQTTTAPSSDVVFDRLALKQDNLDNSSDLSINSLTTDSQAALSLLSFGSSAGQTGEFRFYDLNDSNYVAFKSPDTVASNIIWTLPPSDGSSGQILSTNGSGVLSWVTDSGGGGSSASTFDVTPIGTGAGQTGEMRYQELAANGSNYVTFKAPDSLAADLSFVLPATDGTSGNVLTTNGSGTLSWSAPAGGSALPPANAGQNGYLTSGDWSTFNSKQEAISGTSDISVNSITSDSQFGVSLDPYGTGSGQTGSIQFNELAANGSNYAAFKASDNMASNITWALPDSDGSTGQVLSTDGSGQLSWVAAGSSMSQANGSTDGFLSMGDWTTFNNKESAITAGTTAQYFRGDKTWQALTTDSLTIGTNQFYTAAAARSDLIETASLTNGQTTTAPSSDVVFDRLALKQDLIDNTVDLVANSFESDAEAGVSIKPFGAGVGETGEFRFYELGSTNYVGFKAADTLAADLIWTLPSLDGTSGQVLTTDGAGVLSWTTAAGGGGGTSASTFTVTEISGVATGQMRFSELSGVGSNFVSFRAPDSIAANIFWTLPATDGSSGQVLSTDGSGLLSWASAEEPLSQANGSTDGFLAMEDWSNFNNKQNAITSGTSSQYLKGDFSLGDFNSDVIGASLTGFTSAVGAISASDSVLSAINKLDANIAAKEVSISPGTAAQYFRGDKTWQALNTDNVTEGSNSYYTATAARADLLETASITDGLSTKSPSSNLVFDALATKQALLSSTSDLSVNSLETDSQSGLSVKPFGAGAGETGEFRFYEIGSTNYVGFKAADNLAADLIWTLPSGDGVSGQVLTTDGAGVLSWATAGGGGGGTSASTFSITEINAASTGELRFTELALSGSDYVALRSPASVSGSVTFTLPSSDGSSGEVLSTDGLGNLSWTAGGGGGGGGGGTSVSVETKSSDYTVVSGDNAKVLIVTGSSLITLPPAATAGNGFTVTIKNNDASNTVKVSGDGSETIDGANTISLYNKFSSVEVASSGSEWFVTYSKGNISPLKCPTGFVSIPGNSTLGTDDFCVMKYEARSVSGLPKSISGGTPYSNISADDAYLECGEIMESGFSGSFKLITNPEWMTIARNVEIQDSNWSSGTVGTGHLSRGWTAEGGDDAWTNLSFASSSKANCLYNTAADTCASSGTHKYKRTFVLSTGEEIWDFAGNAAEWVDWDDTSGFTQGPVDTTPAGVDDPREVNDVNGSLVALDVQPSDNTYTSTEGMGRWFALTDPSAGHSNRGGGLEWGANGGAFALSLEGDGSASTEIGFRCVYRP
ncbi:MAG: hypothetical protein ACJAT2_002750 [Bacteriovoracaceae bacterium]